MGTLLGTWGGTQGPHREHGVALRDPRMGIGTGGGTWGPYWIHRVALRDPRMGMGTWGGTWGPQDGDRDIQWHLGTPLGT